MAGHDGDNLDYQTLLRCAYCLRCKIPNDAAVHMCRKRDETYRACEHRLLDFTSRMKIALSFTEVAHASSVRFRGEIVEPDSGRTGSKKRSTVNPQLREHQGRTMIVKGRSSKQWATVALQTSYSKKGRGMGTEKRAEVEPALRSMVSADCILAPDGAKAWKGICDTMQVPCASGVSHLRKIFTPVSRFLKSGLTKKAHATLKKQTKGKKAAASESCRYFHVCGGDNSAESTLGHLKNSMRRLGTVGRGNAKKPSLKTVQALSSAALLRQAGLAKVLEALAAYRAACATGTLKLGPNLCWRHESCRWLYN